MKRSFFSKTIGPQWLRALLFGILSLLMGIAAAAGGQWVVEGSLAQGLWPWVSEFPAYLLLSGVLYGVLTALLGAASGSLAIGGCGASALSLVLALVDFFKLAINGSPLEMADFSLAAKLGEIMGVAGDLRPPAAFWQALAVLAVWIGLLALCAPLTRLYGPWRFLAGSWALVAMLGLFSEQGARDVSPLFNVDLYSRIAVPEGHARYGLTLSLWRECFLQEIPGPEGYGPDYMQGVLKRIDELTAAYGEPATLVKPNVLVILSESFYDVTRLEGLRFDADPLEHFHALEQESVSGQFFSHYLGYGTGYLEMSLFEGLTSLDFTPGTNRCFLPEERYDLLDSLTEPFLRQGYRAEMLHAYNDSLYNRTVTYPRLGFSKLLFSDDVQKLGIDWQGSVYGGYYLQDRYFFRGMLERMETINQAGQPAFLFGITMENHQPFDADKFDYACQIGVEGDAFTPSEMDVVRVMVEGITRADQALGELTDTLRDDPTPTLVVFFGDHRPNVFMESGETVYTRLGLCPSNDTLEWTAEQVGELYSTDYLIWSNDAFSLGAQAGERQASSITALGPQILNTAGVGWTRYWALLDRLRQVCLVDSDLYFADGDGTPCLWEDSLSKEAQELLELKQAVTYDAFYGKGYLVDAMNAPPGSENP